jgi:PAS domain S-box-containing protein
LIAGQLVTITLAAVANLGLGIAILSRNRSSHIHRYFAVFSFSVAAWTLSNGLVSVYPGPPWGYVWGRLAFASASLIPISFLLFAIAFPTLQPPPPRGFFGLFSSAAAVAFALSFTPLIVKSTGSVDGALQVQYGPLHLPFGIYFILCLSFSLVHLTRKAFVLTGVEQLQVRYLFAGVVTAAFGATITNLIIPLVMGTSQFSRYGPLFGLLMIAVIAHAIIRHRLMDIKVVIRQGVVFVCASAAAASVFLALAELLKRLTGYEKNTIPVLDAALVALALAVLFQPLKALIQRSFNRYLYRESYDYQRTIRDASRRLNMMLELDSLLEYLTSVIQNTFKVESVTFYSHERASSTERSGKIFIPTLSTARGDVSLHIERTPIPDDSPLITYLQSHHQTLIREEAVRASRDPLLQAAARDLRLLGGDIVFPVVDERSVVGLLIVGPKRSGDPYFTEDIDLLETLVGQAAVAMKNANLYREVVVVNEYVDNILSTMDSGVIAVNSDGDTLLFNYAAEQLTGLHGSAVLGRSYQQLPHSISSPLRDALEAVTSRPQFETLLQHSDGSSVPVVCSTAILRHKTDMTHGALIVFSDLTRLKVLEGEKRRAERLASFGALASGVAHEIKNPLVAIRTFAELLPERFLDTDFREDFAKVVVHEIARIDDLVGRLRGIAATAPRQVGLIDIRIPLRDTLLLLRAQLEQTHTTVRCTFQDEAPFVAVEEAQLKQLFLNLLLNAIEAMGSGGDVDIRVMKREVQEHSWVTVAVTDSGPGIPESVRASIFDPFFTTKSQGSGLGLAICRGIVDAHRGSIRADNRTDRSGAIIVVEFPSTSETLSIVEGPNLRVGLAAPLDSSASASVVPQSQA